MMKPILTALIIFVATICSGQTSHTRFFRDKELTKEVTGRRADFSETVTQNADGTVTTEIKDLSRNEVILRNGEPFGTWTVSLYRRELNLNYNFEMNSAGDICADTISGFRHMDYFENNPKSEYTAPVIATGEPSIFQYLSNNLFYPQKARQSGITGTVYIKMTIDTQGAINNLAIYESADILLDKEAMRVLRELKLSSPPKLNGEPIEVCILFPIRFVLN
jgi:TonB family protein